ncbi:MAG: molecular chaperone TorD family protein [Candidatus Omnitrophota bacterium]
MLKYKAFALAFSYPKGEEWQLVYDRLFRKQELWLDTVEYIAENEFQRVNYLSDIQGFYAAFGLRPEKARPDFLVNELEFMHYLIFKEDYARKNSLEEKDEKASICSDAQKKFFHTYLYPAAKIIAQKIMAQSQESFYAGIAKDFLMFLEEEKEYLSN